MRHAQGEGIGISVPRLEDDRYLRGKGEFIADIRLPGMRDLAFVRSPVAHARIRAVRAASELGENFPVVVVAEPVIAEFALPSLISGTDCT